DGNRSQTVHGPAVFHVWIVKRLAGRLQERHFPAISQLIGPDAAVQGSELFFVHLKFLDQIGYGSGAPVNRICYKFSLRRGSARGRSGRSSRSIRGSRSGSGGTHG